MHQDTILVSMDVASLYTNISQEEGITVCRAYDIFHDNNPPIPTNYLIREVVGLILKETSFNSMAKTISRRTVLPRIWQKLKQNSFAKAESSQ